MVRRKKAGNKFFLFVKHFKRKSVSLKAFATVDILQIEWPHNWQEGNGRRTVLPTMANIHGSARKWKLNNFWKIIYTYIHDTCIKLQH